MKISDAAKKKQYYEALVKRDSSFVGRFYVGVKTTSIFCIATCRARKPKFENTEFYTEYKDALDHGYRPCKICKPTKNANEAPDQVVMAISLVEANLKEKITDWKLKQNGISPEIVRRWFKTNYGMTFHAYQRMHRINQAFLELRSGKRTSEVAYNSGFESLSGFGYTFKKMTGKSPKEQLEKPILINRITTPLGPMFVCATDEGICMLEFVDRRMLESEFQDLQKRLKTRIVIGQNEHTKQLATELGEYFSGKRKVFTVPLDWQGTEFQKQVWNILCEVKFGTRVSYKEQAIKLDKSTAVRAVASANGYNKISIVVPCHRIVGSDGSLTGYGGGLERKAWLLEHEEKYFNATE